MNTQQTNPTKCGSSATEICVRFAVIMAILGVVTVAFVAIGAVMATFSHTAAIIWGVAAGAVIVGIGGMALGMVVTAFRGRN